jgi:hypothetical protein
MVKDLKAGRRATRKVGRKLRRCRKDAVCSSPICPRCLRNLRKSFVLGAISCIDQVCTAEGIPEDWIVAFSAVLTEERYADGELHNADLRRINERLQRRHQRAGLPLVFAGVDISYNEDSAGRWEPHWQLHVYGVCVSVDVAEVTTLLARLYPANNTTPKPLRVRHCENLADALSYLIKPYFGRRVSYLDGTGRGSTRGNVPLKRAQAQELATWIDPYSAWYTSHDSRSQRGNRPAWPGKSKARRGVLRRRGYGHGRRGAGERTGASAEDAAGDRASGDAALSWNENRLVSVSRGGRAICGSRMPQSIALR